MKTRTIAALLACSVLLVLLQLVALLIGPVTGVVCGAVLAVVSMLLLRFFQMDLQQNWVSTVLTTGASLLAVAIVYFTRAGQPLYIWFACLLAFGIAVMLTAAQHAGSSRCGLCNRRLRRQVAFACPRCGLTVCDHSCWVFEASRCRLCEQNRVPIFSPDTRWWDRQLGPRAEYGRCQLCQVPAKETDLRVCRRCGRPQCRACWDASNGQCSRCQWTIEDLPDSLRPYVLTTGGEARVSARRR